MNLLAIETTGATASAALITADNKIYRASSDDEMNHLSGLLPMADKILSQADTDKKQLTHIAVSVGPGSFTGIRIGLATAKTLAQALNIPVVPVSALRTFVCADEGFAFKAAGSAGNTARGNAGSASDNARVRLVCPMFDARRGQVYCGGFVAGGDADGVHELIREGAADAADFIAEAVNTAESKELKEIVFYGDGADSFADAINEAAKTAKKKGISLHVAEKTLRYQDAANVAVLAKRLAEAGIVCTYNEVQPVYLRKAEAERKLESKQLGKKKKNLEKQVIQELPPADEAVSYRFAVQEDIDEITELDSVCFSNAWSKEAFEGDFYGAREHIYAVAENSQGKIIAYAGLVYVLDEAEINRVAVNPLYRGRGIAGHMMKFLLDAAEKKGIKEFLLEVREANRSAIALYKNCGFRVIAKRNGYYAQTGENALIMKR